MRGVVLGLLLLMPAQASATDFGIRSVGPEAPSAKVSKSRVALSAPSATLGLMKALSPSIGLPEVKGIGARFGRVTSTFRTKARNRQVGGVPNSWHLSGRAVDIARAPGVSHSQIAAAYRAAGYKLIESLDEGDHSHFAFARGADAGSPTASAPQSPMPQAAQALTFRVIGTSGSTSR